MRTSLLGSKNGEDRQGQSFRCDPAIGKSAANAYVAPTRIFGNVRRGCPVFDVVDWDELGRATHNQSPGDAGLPGNVKAPCTSTTHFDLLRVANISASPA